MSPICVIALAILIAYLPGLYSQCVDCDAHWRVECHANYTGYFCEQGGELETSHLTKEEYATSVQPTTGLYGPCTPYPFKLESVRSYCCFYSPTLGCQVAINRKLYRYESNPASYCSKCKDRCLCTVGGGRGYVVKPWSRFMQIFVTIGLISRWRQANFWV